MLVHEAEKGASGCLEKWLERIFKVASIIGVGILFWYTKETYQLRLTAQQQLKYTARPFVVLDQSEPDKIVIANRSTNVATNIFLLAKDLGQYRVLQGDRASQVNAGLTPETIMTIETSDFVQISEEELLKKFSYLGSLIKYIDSQDHARNFVILYEDLLGNKLYTITYGQGEIYTETMKTRYLDELKN